MTRIDDTLDRLELHHYYELDTQVNKLDASLDEVRIDRNRATLGPATATGYSLDGSFEAVLASPAKLSSQENP